MRCFFGARGMCWLLLAGLGAGVVGCKKELPAPWREMGFPLGGAEILPGPTEKGFQLKYAGAGQQADLFRECQHALESGGYAFERNGTSHDPSTNAYSAIMRKGTGRVLLTVSGDRPVHVRVTTSVD